MSEERCERCGLILDVERYGLHSSEQCRSLSVGNHSVPNLVRTVAELRGQLRDAKSQLDAADKKWEAEFKVRNLALDQINNLEHQVSVYRKALKWLFEGDPEAYQKAIVWIRGEATFRLTHVQKLAKKGLDGPGPCCVGYATHGDAHSVGCLWGATTRLQEALKPHVGDLKGIAERAKTAANRVPGECICDDATAGDHVRCPVHEPPSNGQRIREAAIMGREEVPWVGESHDKVIADMVAHGEPKPITGEQGFVTNTGQFVTREEAAEIAFEAGQIRKRVPKLFSEDFH